MNEIVKLLLFSLSSVTYLFIISKLLGKKQIAQLEFIDYVMGISIGSIAAEMATDVSDTPFYYYIIGMTVFFLFDLFVSLLGRKGPALKHFFKGRPVMIIYESKLIYKNIKKCKLDVNDVIGLCREQGYFCLEDIAYAVLENSGNISILPKSEQKPTVVKDLKLKPSPSTLPTYLVVDGRISFSSLKEIGQNENWLYEKSKLDKKTIKNVLLATYDSQTKEINLQLKK